MKISIMGSGYVGLSTGVGFAKKGNKVICVDVIKEKVEQINSGKSPIFEPHMDEYLKEVLENKNFEATTDIGSAIKNTEISFISVGTPSKEDGSIDLKFIEQVAKDIGNVLKTKNEYHVIIVKSTVVPGTTEEVVLKNIEEVSGKKVGADFGLCMNPEFLREGKALDDFLNPNRVVIGEFDKKSGDVVNNLYENFNAPIMRTNIKTAEMIKYANNALLATKVSFANEVGNICKMLGIDTYDVMKGVGLDDRICEKFLSAGCGFGGSCFPKDVAALVAKGKGLGTEPKLLEEVLNVNKRQKTKLVEQLENKIGNLSGKKVAILGLAFKPDSDDIREAPAIDIISSLKEKNAIVSVYDPKAEENTKEVFPNIKYAKSSQEALKDADACLIVTDWKEFKDLTDDDFNIMKNKIIIEGRKVLDSKKVSEFDGICW